MCWGMQQEIMGSLLPTQEEQQPHKYTPKDGAQITDQLLQLIFTNLQKERKPKQVLLPLPYRVGNGGL